MGEKYLKLWSESQHINDVMIEAKYYLNFYDGSLCEKWPDTEFFLVRIFLYSDQKKLRIWTLFT